MAERSTTRLPPQALILLLGLLLWALRPTFALWALIAAYAAAWIVLNVILPRGRGFTLPFGRLALLGIAAVLVAGPLASLYRGRYELLPNEGLRGVDLWAKDRTRLERLPAIAPPTVFADHPQSFYVHAPDADTVSLQLGQDVQTLTASALGAGLYRLDYDPRVHGLPATTAASLDASLVVDDKRVTRELGFVQPLAHPRWFASAPQQGLAATVSEETDEVFLVSRQGLEWRVPVGDGPTDVVFDEGTRLVVAHRYEAALWVLDTTTGNVEAQLPLPPFQERLATSPDDSHLAVACGGAEPALHLFALPALTPVATIPLETAPDWLAFGPTPDVLIVSSRSTRTLSKHVHDPATGTWHTSESLILSRPAVTLAPIEAGHALLVAITDFRPDGEIHRGNHFIQDQLLTIDVEAWRVRDRHLTARRTPVQTFPGNVDSGISPMGLVARADGSVLVAFAGSDEVWELPPNSHDPWRVVSGYDLDLIAPHGVADLGEGYWAASSPSGGAMAVFNPYGELTEFLSITPGDSQLWEGGPGSLDRQALQLRAGEYAFYEATRSGISCQSCHLHADTDHSPHDIGQQPLLPTLTVRGIAGTAPYLRDGSFPRIRDLNDHLAESLYRGYRRQADDRRWNLEAYVERLPRQVNPARLGTRDLPRERAGVAAFMRARCVTCHTFPAFTHLGQHPVRALFPEYGAEQEPDIQLDTPTLLDSHARSHFFQDGRAHDLEEVLVEHNPSNQHGDTAALSDGERADLIHFLLSL